MAWPHFRTVLQVTHSCLAIAEALYAEVYSLEKTFTKDVCKVPDKVEYRVIAADNLGCWRLIPIVGLTLPLKSFLLRFQKVNVLEKYWGSIVAITTIIIIRYSRTITHKFLYFYK